MEIALNVQVECSDGVCGRSVYVLVNPVSDHVSHLVVKEDESPNTMVLVPVGFVDEATTDTIRLRCSKAEFEKMQPFIKTMVIEEKVPSGRFGATLGLTAMGAFNYYLPYVTIEKTVHVAAEEQQIPPGELAVNRGTRVEATDGYVGHVDEFVVNPKNGHLSHFVMREGHLWGKKDVIIPLSDMDKIHDDTVFLKLDKHQIEALPTYPVHRRWV
jgi:sporulation protein YlmC with PRC-barrel domain